MGRKSKADVRKKEILEHFYEVLIEEGFENSSIAKIAKRMDVNPSLLIHYFKTKEEMVVDLVDFCLKRYEDAYMAEITKEQTARERLDMIFDVLFGAEWLSIVEHSVFYACYYLAARHERILKRFQELYVLFRSILTQLAQQWIEEGIIAPADPKHVAEYLMVLNEGMTYYEGIDGDKDAYVSRGKFIRQVAIKGLGVKM